MMPSDRPRCIIRAIPLPSYFSELRQREVRRMSLPRTSVNKGKKKGRTQKPGPSVRWAPLALRGRPYSVKVCCNTTVPGGCSTVIVALVNSTSVIVSVH